VNRKDDVKTAYKSETGRRAANEDSVLVLSADVLCGAADTLMVVADGMGGRASGAAASKTAVETVSDCFKSTASDGSADLRKVLHGCLKSANRAVYSTAATRPELNGMGTTCVLAAVRQGIAYYAHLGDSRAYLLRNGQIARLTEDHSFVAEKIRTGELTEEQARKSRFRNVITRAVGLSENADPESGSVELKAGDVVLLCTDGLTTAVSDDEIAQILCTSAAPGEACDRLVSAALKRGSMDNITVALCTYGMPLARTEKDSMPRVDKSGTSWLLPSILALLLGIGLGAYPVHDFLAMQFGTTQKSHSTVERVQDLAHVSYAEPELLISHMPLDGKSLAYDQRGYLYLSNTRGELVIADTDGRVNPRLPNSPKQITGKISSPMRTADAQGNLYVSDAAGRRIVKYDSTGKLIGRIGGSSLTAPQAIAVDQTGSIYVVDGGRLKVMRVK